MNRFWDSVVAIIIGFIALSMFFSLVAPYIPWIIVSVLIFLGAKVWYTQYKNW